MPHRSASVRREKNMADLPRYEKWALLLTAGFVLFTGGWFLAGHSSPEPYTITAARPDGSVPLQPDGSRSDEGGRPDSLLEGEIIDLNTAAPEDLERLPGIGPAKAEAIAAYRTEHGPFRTVDQLMEVSGIGEATLEALRPYITASAPG
ncbi:MAG: helix-hairpin-helix domain-containing protein [Oscillospiraceae bacterium]|nr:helix-hairpin-helix domain-containing protein [Oscillospiraceae bacterium]